MQKLRTISDVEKEFKEKFVDISEDKTLWNFNKYASVGQVRFFISQSLRQLLEQVVPEEEELKYEHENPPSYAIGFMSCRRKVENKIKEISR